MARGGKREGAGRPAGAANRMTVEAREAITASGMTPLEYMLKLMRDEGAEEAKRLEAAKSAAPYVHPRLAAVELSGEIGLRTHEEWLDGID